MGHGSQWDMLCVTDALTLVDNIERRYQTSCLLAGWLAGCLILWLIDPENMLLAGHSFY